MEYQICYKKYCMKSRNKVFLRPEYGVQKMILLYVIVGRLRSRSNSICTTSEGAGEIVCSIFETRKIGCGFKP